MSGKVNSQTTADDVIALYTQLEAMSIKIRIDGGWAVDALLERQSRPHKDVDIIIEQKDLAEFNQFLASKDYRDVPQNDTRPENYVLGDDQGHLVDVHVIVLDEKGNGIYGPPEKGVMYPAEALTGMGVIAGHSVRCISPEQLIKFHSGYELKGKDYRDVSALCEKFSLGLPAEYQRFQKQN